MNNIKQSLLLLGAFFLGQTVQAQVWSPDGQSIAFFYIHAVEDIYTVAPDGTNFRVIDKHPERDFAPQWSPDGKTIIFTSVRDGHHELYCYALKKERLKKLTNSDYNSEDGYFSPDGRSIIFTSNRGGNNDIYRMNKKGKKIKQLTATEYIETTPKYAPNGQQILFRRAKEEDSPANLFVMNTDGTNVKQLTNIAEGAFHQSWSPNGQKISYVTVKDGVFEIHIMEANGENDRILVRKEGYQAFYPHWSPDSQVITFTRDVIEGTEEGLPGLFSVNMSGNEKLITDKNSFE